MIKTTPPNEKSNLLKYVESIKSSIKLTLESKESNESNELNEEYREAPDSSDKTFFWIDLINRSILL